MGLSSTRRVKSPHVRPSVCWLILVAGGAETARRDAGQRSVASGRNWPIAAGLEGCATDRNRCKAAVPLNW